MILTNYQNPLNYMILPENARILHKNCRKKMFSQILGGTLPPSPTPMCPSTITQTLASLVFFCNYLNMLQLDGHLAKLARGIWSELDFCEMARVWICQSSKLVQPCSRATIHTASLISVYVAVDQTPAIHCQNSGGSSYGRTGRPPPH